MSGLPFELLLALRYLRPKRTFVSVITLISALGVTLGVAVLIIVLSVMSGFDRQSREKIIGFNPHLTIAERKHTMRDYSQVVKVALANRQVKAAAPFVFEQVLVVTEPASGQRQVWAPGLRGIVPQLETNMSILPKSIIEGKFDVSDRGLLVGRQFASTLNLAVNDRVEVYAPDVFEELFELVRTNGGQVPPNTRLPVVPEYDVRGIFDVGYYDYNLSVIVGSLRDTQDLYRLDNMVHGVMVTLHDPYRAPVVQEELARALGPKYQVKTWMEENSNLLGALVVEKNVMFYLLFFIMIVAALCILSALITFVVQKTREIGMLKALGAADLQVSLLFLSQGALVGLIGVLAGYGLGRLALAYRNEFLGFMRHFTGFEIFPASIYNFTELPALIIPRDIWLVCGSALLVCTLGGAIPAWLAGRLKPVDALRYE
jgi:lipoprotein-releasing system permease protein